jgi:hypothetical protein
VFQARVFEEIIIIGAAKKIHMKKKKLKVRIEK